VYDLGRRLSSDLGLYSMSLGISIPLLVVFTYIKCVARVRLTVSRARMEDVRTWGRLLQV